MIRHVNDAGFEQEVKSKKGVCLVDFYATWCGPCMRLSPILDEIANSRANFDIVKIDVDENPNISKELKIDTIPMLCVYQDGKVVEKHIGFRNKDEIIAMLEKYIGE